MQQFDVCHHIDSDSMVVIVQSDLLAGMHNQVVIPLIPVAEAPMPIKRLNPLFTINGIEYAMVTQYLTAVRSSALTNRHIQLYDRQDDIKAALDMLFQGY